MGFILSGSLLTLLIYALRILWALFYLRASAVNARLVSLTLAPLPRPLMILQKGILKTQVCMKIFFSMSKNFQQKMHVNV